MNKKHEKDIERRHYRYWKSILDNTYICDNLFEYNKKVPSNERYFDSICWIDVDSMYVCAVVRHNQYGHLNGYVFLPEGHPVYGIDLDDAIIMHTECHGGLTYASKSPVNESWIIGFDCNHAWDIRPCDLVRKKDSLYYPHGDQVYRNLDYVKENVKELAHQMHEIANS